MNNTSSLATIMEAYPQRLRQMDEPLCLDFVNAFDVRDGTSFYGDVASYRNLVLWGFSASVLDERQAERFLEAGERRPEDATATYERAVELRESLYRLFSAAVHGVGFPAGDLAVFNAELARALSRTVLVAGADRLTWGWELQGDELDFPLWPIARATAQLLTSDELSRVGECASDTCECLFLDISKNRGRRFCGEACSNLTRVRRHRERQRAEASAE